MKFKQGASTKKTIRREDQSSFLFHFFPLDERVLILWIIIFRIMRKEVVSLNIVFLGFWVMKSTIGAPMQPHENTNKLPSLGEFYDHHSNAQADIQPFGGYVDQIWNFPISPSNEMLGSQHLRTSYEFSPSELQGHHYGIGNEHSMHAVPKMAWNWEELEPHRLYDTNQMINDFNQETQAGQDSSLHQSLPASLASGSTPNSGLSLDRPELTEFDLRGRPPRLNMYRWQKKYKEHEIVKIYRNIINEWGRQKWHMATVNLFPRLNKHFDAHPVDVEQVLAGIPQAIKRVADDNGYRRKRAYSDSEPNMITPEEFMQWIYAPPHKHIKKAEFVRPHWAPANINNARPLSRIINRLTQSWAVDKETVERLLETMPESEMTPYVKDLLSTHDDTAAEAATTLFQHIYSKLG